MHIGQLDQQVRIEYQGTADDPLYGPQPDGNWLELDTVWARVRDVLPSRSESVAAGVNMAARPAEVTVRYRTDINSKMRLVLVDRGNRILKIASGPAEMDNQQWTVMMAEEFSSFGDAS